MESINVYLTISVFLNVLMYSPVVVCNESLNLSHGDVSYDNNAVNGRYPVDTKASFSCDSGYTRYGSTSRICHTSGNWNNKTPTCRKEILYKRVEN